jgi:hypothetical protein
MIICHPAGLFWPISQKILGRVVILGKLAIWGEDEGVGR